jgi:two-component system NtrC family sensor kinase
LAAIEVVYNEPACWTAACHAHPEASHVLGVLDIGVSLKAADFRAVSATRYVILVGGLSTVVICLLVGLFIDRFVICRVRRLVECTRRVAEGDLNVSIHTTSDDELGELSRSFDKMTDDLRVAQTELSAWTHKLEQEVEKKTRDLGVAQAHVIRSEKLSSVGVLAAGVAHELNNPLTGIVSFAHLVSKRLPEGSPEKEDVQVIVEQAQRCAAIIRRVIRTRCRSSFAIQASASLKTTSRESSIRFLPPKRWDGESAWGLQSRTGSSSDIMGRWK